jgi:hypothetical protein
MCRLFYKNKGWKRVREGRSASVEQISGNRAGSGRRARSQQAERRVTSRRDEVSKGCDGIAQAVSFICWIDQ